MKEIVVISGKGGTGKTSITAALASYLKESCVIADCDVDAADMHLLLSPDFAQSEAFYSGELAYIETALCRNCGRCADVCRFDAIAYKDGKYLIDALFCEGCGYCARICRPNAIEMSPRNVGNWYISTVKNGNQMVHAKLGIGAENSGKLVAKVKKEAKILGDATHKEWMIVDGSPGIGCPVVSSLSGANFVLLVTEPSVSGFHDLKRVYEVIKRFHLKAGCIINKYDINTEMTQTIETYLQEQNITYLGALPYSESFTKAMIEGKSVMEYSDETLKEQMQMSFSKIKTVLGV